MDRVGDGADGVGGGLDLARDLVGDPLGAASPVVILGGGGRPRPSESKRIVAENLAGMISLLRKAHGRPGGARAGNGRGGGTIRQEAAHRPRIPPKPANFCTATIETTNPLAPAQRRHEPGLEASPRPFRPKERSGRTPVSCSHEPSKRPQSLRRRQRPPAGLHPGLLGLCRDRRARRRRRRAGPRRRRAGGAAARASSSGSPSARRSARWRSWSASRSSAPTSIAAAP